MARIVYTLASKNIHVPNGVVTCTLAIRPIRRPVIFVPGILGSCDKNKVHDKYPSLPSNTEPPREDLAIYSGVKVYQGDIGADYANVRMDNLNKDADGLVRFVSDRGNNTSKVTTRVVLSNSEVTPYRQALLRTSSGFSILRFPPSKERGDDTVVAACSEDAPDNIYAQPFSRGSGIVHEGDFGSHNELVSGKEGIPDDGIQQVLEFFGIPQGQAAARLAALADQRSEASESVPGNTLWLYVDGRAQPYVVSPSQQSSGVDPETGVLVTNLPNCAVNLQDGASAIEITDAEPGDYHVTLKGPVEDDFTVRLRLVDTNGNDVAQEAMGHNTDGLFCFDFSLYETPTNVLNLTSPAPMPANLKSSETNGCVYLSWDAAEIPASGYRIYAKSETSPMLTQAGDCGAGVTSLVLADPWNGSGTTTSIVYYVVSVSSSNSESFCVGPVDNRYHVVARFSILPVGAGDSTLFAFTNQSFGDISQWEWDLNGDGQIDSTSCVPPPQRLETNGIYAVTLRVIGPNVSDFAAGFIHVSRIDGAEPDADGNAILRWGSAASNTFCISRSTNLLMESGGFELLPSGSNITAVQGANVFTDSLDTVGPYFYKINVEP